MPIAAADVPRPHVVIVGAGFAGLSAAKALGRQPVDVTIIDRRNYHLFQPLLYQVATAGLSPADIASPIRGVLRGEPNITVMLAEVEDVDLGAREVLTSDRRVSFDYLIVATGARHAYFGHEEWASFAHGLKKIEDATFLRRKILLAFETAEAELEQAARDRLLTFVVVGGGPAGVEMAGAIAELARKALSMEFRNIDPHDARVVLVEAGPRLLPTFDPGLSAAAARALSMLGVEVRLDAAVTGCSGDGVSLGASRIEASTIVWCAGVRASPAGRWLDAEVDQAGRVIVTDTLTLPDHPQVFVLGDTAHARDGRGRPLPGVAPVAKQQGRYAARHILAAIDGRAHPAFRYRDYGAMATIGRKRAVAALGGLRLTGFPAWALWSLAHIYFLIGFRNRFAVVLNWGWSYLTFQRGTRLITGSDEQRKPASGDRIRIAHRRAV